MREIDFLPAWYPSIHRRYRLLIAQAWISAVILLLVMGYALLQSWKVHLAGRVTAQTEAQIRLSQAQLAQLAEKLKYEAVLRRQDEIVARLGIGVETSRLLKALEDAMTSEMALTNLSLEAVEQPRQATGGLAYLHRNLGVADGSGDVDRRLKVLVDGVAPSDIEVASLMEHLQKVGFFQNVAFPYLREGRTRDGHVMREFEVTFELDLNAPGGVTP